MNLNDIDYLENNNKKRIDYFYDNISISSDIGLARKTQDDSVVFLEHEKNRNIKLLAIADGMSGLKNAKMASNISIYEISEWFNELTLYPNDKLIYESLIKKIDIIDEIIRNTCEGGGTTLSIAIVFDNVTFFANIGDSRIYLSRNNKLIQITNDNSISWNMYMNHLIEKKDYVRFHKKSNLLCTSLGRPNKKIILDLLKVNNSYYDNILMFTDGVTDCLSDDEINNIVVNNNTYDLSKKIVDVAICNLSVNYNLPSEDYYNEISGGHDNLTALVLKKKR